MATTIAFYLASSRAIVLDILSATLGDLSGVLDAHATVHRPGVYGQPGLIVEDDLAPVVMRLASRCRFSAAIAGDKPIPKLGPSPKDLRFLPDCDAPGDGCPEHEAWVEKWVRAPEGDELEALPKDSGYSSCEARSPTPGITCYLPSGHEGDHICIWNRLDGHTTICGRWPQEGEK